MADVISGHAGHASFQSSSQVLCNVSHLWTHKSVHAGADAVAADYLNISLPGQHKQQKATPSRSDSGTPFALLTSAATQPHNTHNASSACRPLAYDGTPLSALSMSFGTMASHDLRTSVSIVRALSPSQSWLCAKSGSVGPLP